MFTIQLKTLSYSNQNNVPQRQDNIVNVENEEKN